MKTERFSIENNGRAIPCILWGEPGARLLLAVHGAQASKEDPVIVCAAEEAAKKGLCTLSFDLPEHGARGGESDYPFTPWNGKSDLLAAYRHARTLASEISLFACSFGAYVSLLARGELEPEQLLFLSPVLSMRHLIEGMMASAGVTEERLKREGHIPVPGNQPLDWAYYQYVCEHPVEINKRAFVSVLRGEKDFLCSAEDTAAFIKRCGGFLTVLPGGEHWFHTAEQMAALRQWLARTISPVEGEDWFSRLCAKDAAEGCRAAELLVEQSEKWDVCGGHFAELTALLEHPNSLVRNRAAALLAAYAKWDTEGRIDAMLERLLAHITDEKPITARQCIPALTKIAAAKPALAGRIREALCRADVSRYPDSMRPLVLRDIAAALQAIQTESGEG